MAAAFAAAYAVAPWKAIYCSPLQRAVETATPISEKTGVPLQLRSELVEIGYGAWEGQTPETVSRDFHDDFLRWTADPAWNAPTGGEAAIAIAHRTLQLVEEIQSQFSEGNVLLVSHKATIRVALCALLGIDVGRFRFRLACPVASLSVVEFSDHGPLLLRMADRSHLSEQLRSLPGT